MKRAIATLMVLAGGCTAWAQTTPTVAEPAGTPAPAPASPVYQDRVIEGLTSPAAADADGDEALYNPDGWARYLRFETRLGTDPFDDRKTSAGLAFYGLIETPNYGVLSVDVNAAAQGQGSLTLRQRGLPVEGGWRVNNEAGVLGSLAPPVTRLPSRVYVPGNLVEGLSTEWSNAGRGLQLQASSGQPGRLEGSPTSGFRAQTGHISSMGTQLDSAPWQLAARLTRADQISLLDTPVLPSDLLNAQSAQVSVRREQDALSLQANLITTRASNVSGQHSGVWLDGGWKQGSGNYSWGLYWLDTDLSWAGQPMVNDTSGAYVRTTWHTRQWSAEGGLDWLRSVSSPDITGVFATGSLRGRYSRDLSFGLGGSVRHFNGNAWTTYADARWQNDWGSSSARLSLASELDQTRSQTLTLDHDWLLPTSWSLNTSLSAGHEASALQSYNRWTAAASLGGPVSASTLLRGHFSTDRTSAGASQFSTSLNVSWRINPRWSLESSYNYARGQGRTVVLIDPLAPPTLLPVSANSSRAILMVLRFEDRAGSRSAPLGGRVLDGGGRIEGTVFLDANRNGRQEANEVSAANATVYLDNLYAVRTDSQGRFEFPFVSAGPHVVTVLNETLPLPWAAAGDGGTSVEVRVREDTRLSIGVVRQGSD